MGLLSHNNGCSMAYVVILFPFKIFKQNPFIETFASFLFVDGSLVIARTTKMPVMKNFKL